MFRTPGGSTIQQEAKAAEKNYTLQKNDLITIKVYTNAGERIIDPDFELMKDVPAQGLNVAREPIQYLINADGTVRLPMIGLFKVEGLTLLQAEEVLQKEYSKFYQDPFVDLQFHNKRVIVLGAPGGQVIPLLNENVTLVEILAIAKGINNDGKAHNIRLIRGDQVFVADFSTFEGYKKSNMLVEAGDVIYVEPIRRPFLEGLRDYGPAVSVLTGLTTLIVVLISL
jgi:polysaccharide biosynthesis/export protein